MFAFSFEKKKRKETGSEKQRHMQIINGRLSYFLHTALSGLFHPFVWYLIKVYTYFVAPYVENKHYRILNVLPCAELTCVFL